MRGEKRRETGERDKFLSRKQIRTSGLVFTGGKPF